MYSYWATSSWKKEGAFSGAKLYYFFLLETRRYFFEEEDEEENTTNHIFCAARCLQPSASSVIVKCIALLPMWIFFNWLARIRRFEKYELKLQNYSILKKMTKWDFKRKIQTKMTSDHWSFESKTEKKHSKTNFNWSYFFFLF